MFTDANNITAADAALDSGAGFHAPASSGLAALWDATCCGIDADDGAAWLPGGDTSCDEEG